MSLEMHIWEYFDRKLKISGDRSWERHRFKKAWLGAGIKKLFSIMDEGQLKVEEISARVISVKKGIKC
jgi:hypothetical protein